MNVMYYRMVNQNYGLPGASMGASMPGANMGANMGATGIGASMATGMGAGMGAGFNGGAMGTYPCTYSPVTSTALAASTPTGLASTPAAMATAGLGGAAGLTPKWIIPNFSATQIQYMFRPRMGKGVKVNRAVKCDTCSITLNSEQQAKQHYSGKSHLKKLRQMGMPVPGSETGKVPAQTGKNTKRKRSSSESKDSKSKDDSMKESTGDSAEDSTKDSTKDSTGDSTEGSTKDSTGDSTEDSTDDSMKDSTGDSIEDAKSEASEHSSTSELEDSKAQGIKREADGDVEEGCPPKKSPRLSPEVDDPARSEEVKDAESTGTNENQGEDAPDSESEKEDTVCDTLNKMDHDANTRDQELQERNSPKASVQNMGDHIKAENSIAADTKEISEDKAIAAFPRDRSSSVTMPSNIRNAMPYKPVTSQIQAKSSQSSTAPRSSFSYSARNNDMRLSCLLPTPTSTMSAAYTPYQQFTPQRALPSASQLMGGGLQQYPSLNVSPYMPVTPLSFPQHSPTTPSQLSGIPGLLAPLYAPSAISSSAYSSMVTPQTSLGATPFTTDPLGGGSLPGGTCSTPHSGLLDLCAMSSYGNLPLNSTSTHQMGLQTDSGLLSRQQQSFSQSHLSLTQFTVSETNPAAATSGASQAIGASSLPAAASQAPSSHVGGAASSSKLDPVTQAVYDNMMGKLPLKRKKNIPCTVCDMVFDSDVVANQHFLGAKHCKKARTMTAAEAIQAKSPTPPASTDADAKLATTYHCSVCNVDLNSPQQYEEHNTGQLHLKNQKERDRPKAAPLKWASSTLGWGEEAGNKPGWYHCQLCDISVQTPMQLQQHIRSQRHRDRPPGGYGRLAAANPE